ncbi:MAG: serine hydrolase [Bacteroidia bacterium]
MKNFKTIIITIAIILVSLLLGYYLGSGSGSKNDKKEESTSTIKSGTTSGLVNPMLQCTDGLNLNMKELKTFRPKLDEYLSDLKKKNPEIHISYYFRDLNNGLWIGIEEKELFSPASLMKIPVMIAVLKRSELDPIFMENKIQYDTTLLDKIDEDEGNGFKKHHGEWYSIDELITQMITYSDNKATLMLMQAIGMEEVMKVSNELNLDVKNDLSINSNFMKVKSYAAIFRILYNGTYLNKVNSEKALNYLTKSEFSKGIRAAISSDVVIAHKYGTRDEFDKNGKSVNVQLHHFGIIYHKNKPFLMGIMTRGGAKEVREKIIYDLSKITYQEVDDFCKRNSLDN